MNKSCLGDTSNSWPEFSIFICWALIIIKLPVICFARFHTHKLSWNLDSILVKEEQGKPSHREFKYLSCVTLGPRKLQWLTLQPVAEPRSNL